MRKEFLNLIEGFLKETQMSDTRLGTLAIGDPNLVKSVRHGRDCRISTIERVKSYIKKYRAEHPIHPNQRSAS